MSVTNILESITTKKSSDVLTYFQNEMYSRIFDKLNERRQELAQTLFLDEDDTEDKNTQRRITAQQQDASRRKLKELSIKYNPSNANISPEDLVKKMNDADKQDYLNHLQVVDETGKKLSDLSVWKGYKPNQVTDTQRIQKFADAKNRWGGNDTPYKPS